MNQKNLLLTMMVMVFFTFSSFAQGTLIGKVLDGTYNDPLIGATIVQKGTTNGTVTDVDGLFLLKLPAGEQTVTISYVGYTVKDVTITITDGQRSNLGRVKLEPTSMALEGVDIIADRAVERETPVAISNVPAAEIEQQLGGRDLPMIMNNTPSVYATQQGGGAGDSRINVRGFNQNNVAIMINGVPINDMENGWVYWSNWDGLADATSNIQMQRGLSAINLATPSVGGTMNIITSPAEMEAGASGKFEYGSGNFMKTTLTAHTGLINEKFAASVSVVRKVGEGVIDKTWTDAWAYYLGMSYNISSKHRLELYAMGAPQRHGQNLYKQNVAAYDSTYSADINGDDNYYTYDYSKYTQTQMDSLNAWGVGDLGTVNAFESFFQSPNGRLYNENWNNVNSSYSGDQYWNGSSHSRYNSDFINERENYYHKPVVNLNWYAIWSKKLSLFTTVYYSGGSGGGSGTYGDIAYDYSSEPTRIVDWNQTIADNKSGASEGGILRNSTNNQWTIGAISKLKINFSEHFKGQVGVDWRKAEIDHFREVRDLLGLTAYDDSDTRNDFEDMSTRRLGDKIAYWNTNTVDWGGAYVQGEYKKGNFSAYATAGISMIKYSYLNHFIAADTNIAKDQWTELKSNTDWIIGGQVKGGVNYNFSETFSAFANLGYVSKVPIFDNVIDDGDGTVAEDPKNETFTSAEGGVIFNSTDHKLNIKGNLYYTIWSNRIITQSVQVSDNEFGIAFISGVDQRHMGLELEANYRPIKFIGFGGIASIANWKYLNNVNATIKTYDGGITSDTVNLYIKDLYVGDAPQTQFALWTNIYPFQGLNFQFIWRFNGNHYAEFNPTSRDDETDTEQVWKTPSYSVFDLNVNYELPIKGRVGVTVFGHVFNVFDTYYIQDAVDNSSYNSFQRVDLDRMLAEETGRERNTIANPHTGSAAEVYLGTPFTFNVGVKVLFH